ncbi:uncharacterized protein [Typha latifolia]|uniref:uncharacterized protein n=1 Tax=Typha latifolia TaxID=4733 RepID=UPI003C30E3A3
MGNSLRCCLACVLPCGALDVIRIVHLNGQVEEYSRQVSAAEILEANPDHIISKPCFQGVAKKIVIVSADTDLKRGIIYFLIPKSSLEEKQGRNERKKHHQKKKSSTMVSKDGDNDKYLIREVSRRRRRSGRVGVWRPQLESISED